VLQIKEHLVVKVTKEETMFSVMKCEMWTNSAKSDGRNLQRVERKLNEEATGKF
jgi:hypothetical protein